MPAPLGPTPIDRVDDRNHPIGFVRRSEAFARRANFRTVHVLLTNSRGRVLVQQLAATRDRHPGQWGSSVAGYLFAGESYEQAARRRLREELGLLVDLEPCGVLPVQDTGVTKFVGVFSGTTEDAQIVERDHIAAIEFRDVSDIETGLTAEPSTYTDTFAQVFGYWRHWKSSSP